MIIKARTEPSAEDVISASKAAKLLFVSRPHAIKLIDSGALPLHHISGQNRFVRRADVLAYKARKETEAKAFLETHSEDGDPPGL
jgi:excisionase family DNA binding protein